MASPKVRLTTTLGDIELELCEKDTPITVRNFLEYVDSGHYNGTIFHEAHLAGSNKRGTIAMARTNVVDSATAQFFINLVDNDFLDHKNKSAAGYGYCVFGFVTKGMDVVDKIAKVETGPYGYHDDVPVEPVIIEKAERI